MRDWKRIDGFREEIEEEEKLVRIILLTTLSYALL